jgi:hypothetical protein
MGRSSVHAPDHSVGFAPDNQKFLRPAGCQQCQHAVKKKKALNININLKFHYVQKTNVRRTATKWKSLGF